MKKFNFINSITTKYKYIILAVILISLPFAYYFSQQKHFYHVSIFFEKGDESIVNYNTFLEKYGNDEAIVVVFKNDDIFTTESIETIKRICKRVERLKGVQKVISITELEEAVGDKDSITFKKIIKEQRLTRDELLETKERLLNHKWVKGFLISKDTTTTAIVIELIPLADIVKRDTVDEIKKITQEIAGAKTKLHFTGVPLIEIEMNELSKKDKNTFVPITGLLIFIIVLCLLRSLTLAILCQINLMFIFIFSVGLFVGTGETFNIVTSIIGPILLAISIADSIHFLSHYREDYLNNGGNHTKSVKNAIKYVWLPCFFTSITTAIGFLSFFSSSIIPVKILGIYTAIGVIFAFIFTVVFLPSMLMISAKRPPLKKEHQNKIKNNRDKEGIFEKNLHRLAIFTTKYYKSIGLFAIILFVLFVMGVTKINFESDSKNYLHKTNQLRTDIEFTESNMGGLIPFILLIKANSPDIDFTHSKSLKLLDNIQHRMLGEIDIFSNAFSITDYFKEIHKAFNADNEKYYKIPETQKEIQDYYELGDPEVIDRIISPDFMEARISFQSFWCTNQDVERAEKHITTYLNKILGDNFSFISTGLAILYISMENNLVETQSKSLIFATILISIFMFFVCKTISLTIIAMIANLFPILLILGFMGWYGIPLDVTTIMIASVTIGIAVDDTIHLLTWIRRNIESGESLSSSIIMSFHDVGKPIAITSFVLFCGFFILILGNLKPTQSFGVLTALAMILALIGDLILLPALLLIFKPKFKK